MGRRGARRAAVVTAVAAVSLALIGWHAARADWPVARHSARRTGAATGSSNIRAPEEIWRFHLGGGLAATSLAIVDVDGDGADDFVMVSGGSILAKRLDDTLLWSVPARGFVAIIGTSDLDGDGDLELVAQATASVAVVDVRAGRVEWELPPGTMKQYGAVRIGDLDGDGLPDLTIVESGPCAAAPGYWPGAVFSFAAGAAAPVERWELPTVVCGKGSALTLYDADGDVDLEVLEPTFYNVQLLDGRTGAVRSATPDLGPAMTHLQCTPVETDGTPGEELACVHDLAYVAAQRSVLLLDVIDGALTVAWRTYLANADGGEMRVVDLVANLGGPPVLVVSVRDSPDGVWTTVILDAATGARRPGLLGHRVAGTLSRPGGGRYLMTVGSDGVYGWRMDGDAPSLAWQRLGDEEPIIVRTLARAQRSAIASVAASFPWDGRVVLAPRSRPDTLRAVDVFDGGSRLVAEVGLPPGVTVGNAFVSGADRIAFVVSRSDGFLAPYDNSLVLQSDVDGRRLPRTGGYVATGTFRTLGGPPRTGDLDGDGRDEVVVDDGRDVLVRLDPEDAALHAPPRASWSRERTTFPAITRGADGAPAIACVARDDTVPGSPSYALLSLSAAGAATWSSPLGGPPLADVIPGDLDGDDVPDLAVQWGVPTDLLLHTEVHRGTDGERLWEHVIDPGSGRAPAGAAIAPWPGQTHETVVHIGAGRVWVLAGETGAVAFPSGNVVGSYALPTMVQLDGDAGLEIALTGSGGLSVLDDDLSPYYLSTDDKRPYPYGSIARCADGAVVLISEALAAPPRLLLTTLTSGASGLPVGTERARWLAGGALHATEGEAAEAGYLGQLTSSTVHEDLVGAGRPSTLVGSSDGFLYAVDPCAGTLDFSISLGAAAGEAVYGDLDGDGKDEILVTAGDGYLRALQHHTIDAPAWVADLDARSGSLDDVDELPARASLGARWEAVPGALRYQVAVVDRDGGHLLTPPWQGVDGTDVAFAEPMAVEQTYVLVRAIGPDGRSTDRASDGLTFVDSPRPLIADGCCGTSRGGAGRALLAAAVMLLVLGRRRPRRAAPSGRRR